MLANFLGPLLSQFIGADCCRNMNLCLWMLSDQQFDQFLAKSPVGASDENLFSGFHNRYK